MAIWLPYKANPNERKNRTQKQKQDRQRFCKICGKPIQGAKLCQSCSDFIKRKKQEGRRAI